MSMGKRPTEDLISLDMVNCGPPSNGTPKLSPPNPARAPPPTRLREENEPTEPRAILTPVTMNRRCLRLTASEATALMPSLTQSSVGSMEYVSSLSHVRHVIGVVPVKIGFCCNKTLLAEGMPYQCF
uniref:Uncharacterized protein n=1 Tax=Fusarium oxysporum (strain Fo5176) TaxID=660025 RepID=A0A0D2XW70_FUSOF